MKSWLLSEQGKTYLQEEYVVKLRSTYQIAADRNTYANAIRRALQHHGIPLRDKSESQAAALATGRQVHPTQGRKRSDEERQAISESMTTQPTKTETNERVE